MHVAEVTGGKLAVCPHAYGIGATSKFTANTIFDLGIAARNYASKRLATSRTDLLHLDQKLTM